MVICMGQGAYLHITQLMPLLLTFSCSSKSRLVLPFLVLAHLGSPGQRVIKQLLLLLLYCTVCCTATCQKSCKKTAASTMQSRYVHMIKQL